MTTNEPSVSKYALSTHCMPAKSAWRSSAIDGNAALTTVPSRNATPEPSTAAPMTHRPAAEPVRRSRAWAGAVIGPVCPRRRGAAPDQGSAESCVVDLPAMAHPRRFRFAVELHEPFADRTWTDTVREVEALGYSTMFVPDHFDEGLGPLAAMAAAAAVTTTMNVGSLVLDCDFRHPAVLARELATIDVLSEGRLEVGLGAGWKNLDYQRSGIVMERPGVRVIA